MLTALWLLTILAGCTFSDKKQNVASFGEQINLTGKVLIPADSLLDPWMILTIDSSLIVANAKGQPVLDFYALDGRKVRTLLKRGLESGEVGMIGTLQPNYAAHCVYSYDLFRRTILQISVDSVLRQKNYLPAVIEDSATIHESLGSYEKMYPYRYGILGESRVNDGRFFILKKGGERRIRYYRSYPHKVDASLSDLENARLYSMGIALNPENTKVAAVTYSAGMMDLFGIDSVGLDSVWSYRDFLPDNLRRISRYDGSSSIAFTSRSKYGYFDVAGTDKWVYAIYSGSEVTGASHPCSNIIRVTSWDGSRRYQLVTDKQINRISVSRDDSNIYALGTNFMGAPEVYVFNIKDVLN